MKRSNNTETAAPLSSQPRRPSTTSRSLFATLMNGLSNSTPNSDTSSPFLAGDPPATEDQQNSSGHAEDSGGGGRGFWPPAHETGSAVPLFSPTFQNGSPLSRAGLLQPRSYAPASFASTHHRQVVFPHSQDDIRANTMQLTSMAVSPNSSLGELSPVPRSTPRLHNSFIFPRVGKTPEAGEGSHIGPILSVSFAPSSQMSSGSVDLTASTSTLSSADIGITTPKAPSGLSLLMASRRNHEDIPEETFLASPNTPTPRPSPTRLTEDPAPLPVQSEPVSPPEEFMVSKPTADARQDTSYFSSPPPVQEYSESAPLLSNAQPSYSGNGHVHPPMHVKPGSSFPQRMSSITRHVRDAVRPSSLRDASKVVAKSIPAVILGTLLNILDGVSYGMIIFPSAGVFAELGLGPMGVSMFFVSAIISQLVYSAGASDFAGANGSMMIEVVPFFHIIATSIANEIGEGHPREVMATTMVAFALSSVLTGLTFFLLGALKLGVLIGFFPRHILVGCIGGVGVFLIVTGLAVSTRLDDDEFALNLATLRFLFQAHNLVLWAPALAMAGLLRVITAKFHHQLIFPVYFIVIPLVFYFVIGVGHFDFGMLRKDGWLFDISGSDEPWWRFYTYFDLSATRMGPLLSTLPTQLALLFFNILHPPLNVPALGVSLNEDVDTNKELVAHGYSNLLAGFLGTVPNYLVYVNTLLFYRVGGDTRTSGFLLAGATVVLLLIGTGPIAYIPVMVVGALIFVLGIDLVKEALWDTRHRVSRIEYLTIASIMVVMTVWDFVMGVLFGIVASCVFFVVQNSRRRSIRSLHTGETIMSTVRRPSAHRDYLREVSKQTTVIKLQGFLFFGTIAHIEETIRGLVEGQAWSRNPIRFLVLDFTLAAGVDMSAAEALVRVQRLLSAKKIILVLCGLSLESATGKALQNVGLLEEDSVELFSSLSDAMEWTENAYLRAWFSSQKAESGGAYPVSLPGREATDLGQAESLYTPRWSHLRDVGSRTIARDKSLDRKPGEQEPLNTVVNAFSSHGNVTREQVRPLVPYLERIHIPSEWVLWEQGDAPDGLYFIQSGILRASYKFADFTPLTEESMVPGTLAGELSALSGTSRNATCIAETEAVLWRLSIENLRRMETEIPSFALMFTKLVLKAAKIDYDILLSSLATR